MQELQKIEHNGTLVLTTQQIAEAYGTSTDTITRNFNRNKDRYTEGKHYIALEGEEKNNFIDLGQIDRSLKNAKTLYLWTQKGTFLHAKSLNTDTAWEVYDRLVDSYFEKKNEVQINTAELSPELQMFQKIFTSVAQQQIEQKRQAEQLNRIEQKQEVITETFTTNADDDFKTWVNKCIGRIAESPNYTNGANRNARYANARSESYDRLNMKKACRLSQRVAYAKEQALENGATKTIANGINKLTVISNDKGLKPIYETVIKEMMICYCVNTLQ